MNKYDYIIIGSGLAGATLAYIAHQAGKEVLVQEKREEALALMKSVGVVFFTDRQKWESMADEIVFTSRIDGFNDFRFGKIYYSRGLYKA